MSESNKKLEWWAWFCLGMAVIGMVFGFPRFMGATLLILAAVFATGSEIIATIRKGEG